MSDKKEKITPSGAELIPVYKIDLLDAMASVDPTKVCVAPIFLLDPIRVPEWVRRLYVACYEEYSLHHITRFYLAHVGAASDDDSGWDWVQNSNGAYTTEIPQEMLGLIEKLNAERRLAREKYLKNPPCAEDE